MTHSQTCISVLSCIVRVTVLLSITCNNERAFVRRLISMSKKQPEWLWPPSNGKIVRMHWNSTVPMAWVPSDRWTLTQPERTNQSYSRRWSDQDNNHVIEREKKSHFSKEWNKWIPSDGSLLRLIVTSLGEPFVPMLSDKACGRSNNWLLLHITGKNLWHLRRIPPVSEHLCVCVCVCVYMCFRSTGLNDNMINGRASVLSARPVRRWAARGGAVTVAVSGDLIIWWTPQRRGRIHSSSGVARLIRPLLMQSSGGTYRKYWSHFDRVFAPLHNQQCVTATDADSVHATTSSCCYCRGVTLISIPKQAACVCVLRCLPNDSN